MIMNEQANADFLKKLMTTFLTEAREHLDVLGTGLLDLEQTSSREAQLPLLETIFREAHCLKGAARAVNVSDVERLCQTLESVSADVKSGKNPLSAAVFDTLHRVVTAMDQRIETLGNDSPETPPHKVETPVQKPATPLRKTQVAAGNVEDEPTAAGRKPQTRGRHDGADTIRIATRKLDAIFVQTEELLGVKLAYADRNLELKALAGVLAERERLWNETLPVVRKLRQQVETRTSTSAPGSGTSAGSHEFAARLLAFLEQDRQHAEAVATRVADLTRVMIHDRRHLDTMVDRLQEDVKKTLMLPFDTLLAGFPKMVRDLACDVGKEIQFTMRGTDIQIDKRILEKIKDPLLHLVRNSIDHGIETPAQRAARGKPSYGEVVLAITQAEGKVGIEVADDGDGLDPAAVKAAAVQAGVITDAEAAVLEDSEAVQLVFRSGVTTSEQVTTISGRGLGMAIVEGNVAKLNGTVRIESSPGSGTTVHIGLPLTLATLRGILVRAANREFVIPTANIIRVLRVPRASVKRVENSDCICVEGTTLAVVRLADLLGLVPGHTADDSMAPITTLLLGYGTLCVAFVVDQVMGEQEVLAKPLGRLLPRVRNVAGASVLGTGRIVPILNVPDLLQTAVDSGRAGGFEPGQGMPVEALKAKRLLVADDSITARTLLQNILESSGYSVRTTPDGAAAFTTLQNETFDLLVSDVEMPRMDGFELTRRVRANPRLAELPVVLITALEAQDDRARGVEAGANAYIVKSGFDQGNLLEIIARLI
jgi:two-component system chemotaxis sensor kinase CheA